MKLERWIPIHKTNSYWHRSENSLTEYKVRESFWTWRDRVFGYKETRLTEDLPAWGTKLDSEQPLLIDKRL